MCVGADSQNYDPYREIAPVFLQAKKSTLVSYAASRDELSRSGQRTTENVALLKRDDDSRRVAEGAVARVRL